VYDYVKAFGGMGSVWVTWGMIHVLLMLQLSMLGWVNCREVIYALL